MDKIRWIDIDEYIKINRYIIDRQIDRFYANKIYGTLSIEDSIVCIGVIYTII